uniref:Vitelline envelope zona pellucida domain protein 28 n=1 Tax=Haliotis rufescens TaxID=6454 RepID=D0EL66_HALRU|nr:vitelline envelope zona pellucida domain protein 28 [Haliotis rufescens]
MSNYVVVGFLTLLLQVQRCQLLYLPPDGVLNNAAVRVTCSGHELLASKLVVAKQLHPLQGSLILKPQCAGGANAYKPVIPVGKVTNIYYGGDPTSRCLFKKGTAYTLAIQVVAFGTTVVGKVTVSYPLKLVFSQLNRDPYPPYQLKYKSGPMPASIVSIKCNYDSSVDLTFLTQKSKKIILVSCLKVKFTYTVEASSVAMRAVLDADPFSNCVFRDDIPSVRDGASKWKRAAKTIKGIEVSLFDYATLASEGTGVVVPCKPPPPTTTTTPAPTTEKFTTQKWTTQQWTTEGFTTEPTPEVTTPGPTTTENFPTEPSTTPTTRPTTPKVTTPKPTTPKPTTPKPTTPKPTTPKATKPKPTTPKATTPKPTTPKATTPPLAPPSGFTLNKAATWITCSGKKFVPSTIDFSEKLHPLHKFLVLRPSCGGGSDIRALPARLKVYHTGTAKKCLFLVKGSSYTIQVDVLAYGARSIGQLDFSCPIPLAPTSPPPSIFPPYPLRIISNLIQEVDIDCSQNDSITANLLPQRSRVVVALKCQDSTKTFVVKNTPVAVTVWKKGADTQSKCVFRNDHGIQPGSRVPRLNVPVVFFKWADFSYLGTGSIEPCNENPSKYILDVSSHCGRSTSDATWVTGISDVDAEFQAVCKSGKVFKFNNVNGDRVNYSPPVHFTGNAASKCIFNRRGNSQVYVITVKASWGEGSNLIHQSNREYQVTCVYGSRGSDDTQVQSISDRLIAAKSMQENKGPDSKFIIRLDIVDVLGVPVTFMPQGRKVKLRAVGRGQGREVGLKTIGCDAIGTTSNARYAVIRGGCGDGLIFKKTEGLTTRGLTATSPYFKVFAMRNDNLLKFECNFTMCASNCDGSSCSNGRRRRDIWEGDSQIQQAHSRIIRVL